MVNSWQNKLRTRIFNSVQGKEKIGFFAIGILFLLNIFAWQAVFDLAGHQYLEVDFFDVGQGDAIFIETPAGQQILIDGGPNSRILEKLGKEMPFYDRTLDLVVLTHPEKDHLSGLLEVLKRYKIKNILWTGVVRDTSEFKEWESLIKKEGAQVKIAKAGQKVIFDNSKPFISFDVLYPFDSLEGKELEDSNETSIVGRLVFGDNSFLFTGDIGESTEKKLVLQIGDRDIGSDVLKIAHHGSKYSNSNEFFQKVLPDIAVILVGKNNYGHPTEDVLARLNNFGIDILRTDQNGNIKIISNGKNLKLINNN